MDIIRLLLERGSFLYLLHFCTMLSCHIFTICERHIHCIHTKWISLDYSWKEEALYTCYMSVQCIITFLKLRK